jgi:hypothetical protein
LKPYTNGIGVGVGFQVRTDGEVGRSRERGRKTWILKSVTFTLDTDPPTRAPPPPRRETSDETHAIEVEVMDTA